jgi:hypothetical protein
VASCPSPSTNTIVFVNNSDFTARDSSTNYTADAKDDACHCNSLGSHRKSQIRQVTAHEIHIS